MKLVDCYSELLAYTVYLTGPEPSAAAVSYEEARGAMKACAGAAAGHKGQRRDLR
jgi:hypothetical protein